MKLIKLFSREYSVQYTEASLRSLGPEVREHLPALLTTQTYLPEPPNETCYADEQDWKQLLQSLDRTYASGEQLQRLIERFHQHGKTYVEVSTRLGTEVSSIDSNDDLTKQYNQYETALILYSAYLWMGYLLNNSYTEQAKEVLNKNMFDQRDGVEAALLSPTQRSGILQLRYELSELKRQNEIISQEKLKTFLENYSWISCLDIQNNPWSIKNIESFFATIKPSTPSLSFDDAVALARLDSQEKHFFKSVRDLVYVKDMRDEYRRKGVCAILPLFDEIGRRLNVKRPELAYFTAQEIIQALHNNVPLDTTIAHDRQKGFLMYWSGTSVTATSDPDQILSFRKTHLVLESSQKNSSLKGICASTGHATGTAKIVRGVNDLNKVQKGDIMVAVTTHPDFVPAMHRAAAIITDEGGVTSHAAIVSRELKIPCIVGTKNATQILHDGDQVLVDATEGTITIQ